MRVIEHAGFEDEVTVKVYPVGTVGFTEIVDDVAPVLHRNVAAFDSPVGAKTVVVPAQGAEVANDAVGNGFTVTITVVVALHDLLSVAITV